MSAGEWLSTSLAGSSGCWPAIALVCQALAFEGSHDVCLLLTCCQDDETTIRDAGLWGCGTHCAHHAPPRKQLKSCCCWRCWRCRAFFLRTELLLVNAREFLNLHGILRSKTNCVCSLHIGSSLRAPSHCRLKVFMQALKFNLLDCSSLQTGSLSATATFQPNSVLHVDSSE